MRDNEGMKKILFTSLVALGACSSSQPVARNCNTGNPTQDKICRAERACGNHKSSNMLLDILSARNNGTSGTREAREKCIDRHIAADSSK